MCMYMCHAIPGSATKLSLCVVFVATTLVASGMRSARRERAVITKFVICSLHHKSG